MIACCLLIVLAQFDRVARLFGPVFTARSEAVGIRSYGDAIKSGQGPFTLAKDHPLDFELHKICVIDDESGVVDSTGCPQILVTAQQLTERPSDA